MDFIIDIVGRFHPLVVHLPIGFLFLGALMIFYSGNEDKYLPIMRFSFFWGAISTLLALITGFVQYNQEGYAWEDIQNHLIFGIIVLIIAVTIYLNLKRIFFVGFKSRKILVYFLILSLIITGHLGGNLTHGKDHLTAPLPDNFKAILGVDYPIKKIELDRVTYRSQSLYQAIVQPVFNAKCISCHSPKKKKGELVLIDYPSIMNGGEGGSLFSKTDPEQSLLLKRIHLPLEDEKHMPPKAKVQLTKPENVLLSRWIAHGAPKEASIEVLKIEEELFASFFEKNPTGIYPDISIAPAEKEVLKALKKKGFFISPIYKTSPLLKISCINYHDFNDLSAQSLLPIKEHIVSLDLGKTKVTDSVFRVIQKLPNLTVLKLDNTKINGSQIELLSQLKNLKEINLVNTDFEIHNLTKMYNFPTIKKVNLFNLKKQFNSNLKIPDSLKSVFLLQYYELEKLDTDSVVY